MTQIRLTLLTTKAVMYRVPILLSVVSLLLLHATSQLGLSSSEEIIITSILLMIPLWFFLFNHQIIESIQSLSKIIVPISALAVTAVILTSPQLADFLAQEDGLIETLSAVFLFVGSVLMLFLSFSLLRSKYILAATVAGFLGVIFFIICMEEISWGQRLFGIVTPASIELLNDQNEFNFHNMATGVTERLYYLSAFLLLTLAPFIRTGLIKILSKIKAQSLSILVPSAQLLYPFAVISAFIKNEPDTLLFIAILVVSILILLYSFFHARKEDKDTMYILLSLTATIICSAVAYTLDHSESGTRPWFFSEYREFYIATGIMLYSIYVVSAALPIKRLAARTITKRSL